MRIQRALLALAAIAAFGSLEPAEATTTTLVNNGYYNGWSESFNIIATGAPGHPNPVGAGAFSGTWDDGSGAVPIIFWCAELNQFFNPTQPYVNGYMAIALGSGSLLSRLFTEVGGSGGALSDADHSAGFQLAVWDIVYDGGDGLTAGSFQVTSGNSTAVGYATFLLAHLPTTGTFDLTLFHSADNQDFITDSHTPGRQHLPEPPSLALFGLGLVAMLYGARRRQVPFSASKSV
jgi:hypothetical protein